MATSVSYSGDAGPVPFVVSGRIQRWDPTERWLWLDKRPLWVSPGISVPDPGSLVTVVGHQEQPSGRWVVTSITDRDARRHG